MDSLLVLTYKLHTLKKKQTNKKTKTKKKHTKKKEGGGGGGERGSHLAGRSTVFRGFLVSSYV